MNRYCFCIGSALLLLAACGPDKKVHAQAEPVVLTRLIFGGDVMLSRDVRRQILAAKDNAMPFRKIAPLLAASDIAFVNLESPFSDDSHYETGGLVFHSAPEMISGLELAHVAVVSTANNHARDCGAHGVEYTVKWLRAHDIAVAGTGLDAEEAHKGVVLARNGVRFGFLGYTYDQSNGNWNDVDSRIALAKVKTMEHDVADMKKRADVVLVSMHHGIEYAPHASDAQMKFAHAAIDAGASIVIGHHPHVIEPIEPYHGGQIIYSLGNLIFDQYQRKETQHGQVVQVSFLGDKLLAMHVIPVLITKTGPEVE